MSKSLVLGLVSRGRWVTVASSILSVVVISSYRPITLADTTVDYVVEILVPNSLICSMGVYAIPTCWFTIYEMYWFYTSTLFIVRVVDSSMVLNSHLLLFSAITVVLTDLSTTTSNTSNVTDDSSISRAISVGVIEPLDT